ncbi:MAG: nucleotidyl transferase AbiEii/AbiGii toxin family protein [Acidimicrobiales bacterium]
MEPHVGTGDLDLHLSLHLLDGETADYYHAIIEGLRSLGLRADDEHGREVKWRWVGRYRDVRLQVELLCPVRSRAGRPERPATETPAEANIGPGGEITALAVGLGHLVPDDTIAITKRVETASGGLTFEFPVAGLTSWLCLKSDAIMRRDKAKDAYDVVWVLDSLGPDAASEMVGASPLLAGPLVDEVRSQLMLLVHDQFRDEDSVGPVAYATFLEIEPADGARGHALGTVVAFGRALTARGIGW